MRINYRIYPTDYIESLKNSGKRFKARCFMEYWNDVQFDEVNSIGFYAKSWGRDKPLSKGTVHKWITEFGEEIDRFHSAHLLRGREHTSATLAADKSAKNQSERRVNASETFDSSKEPINRDMLEERRTASERRVNQVNNIYDDDLVRMRRREAEDLYYIYRLNTKNAGKKSEAAEAYMSVAERPGFSYRELQKAAILYLNDPSIEKKFNLANFLKNEIYLNYITQRVRVDLGDRVIVGEYDLESETLKADDGTWRLTAERLAELLADGKLEFLVGGVA